MLLTCMSSVSDTISFQPDTPQTVIFCFVSSERWLPRATATTATMIIITSQQQRQRIHSLRVLSHSMSL